MSTRKKPTAACDRVQTAGHIHDDIIVNHSIHLRAELPRDRTRINSNEAGPSIRKLCAERPPPQTLPPRARTPTPTHLEVAEESDEEVAAESGPGDGEAVARAPLPTGFEAPVKEDGHLGHHRES